MKSFGFLSKEKKKESTQTSSSKNEGVPSNKSTSKNETPDQKLKLSNSASGISLKSPALRTRSTSLLLPKQSHVSEFVTLEELNLICKELDTLKQPQDSLGLEQQLKLMNQAIRMLQNYHSSYIDEFSEKYGIANTLEHTLKDYPEAVSFIKTFKQYNNLVKGRLATFKHSIETSLKEISESNLQASSKGSKKTLTVYDQFNKYLPYNNKVAIELHDIQELEDLLSLQLEQARKTTKKHQEVLKKLNKVLLDHKNSYPETERKIFVNFIQMKVDLKKAIKEIETCRLYLDKRISDLLNALKAQKKKVAKKSLPTLLKTGIDTLRGRDKPKYSRVNEGARFTQDFKVDTQKELKLAEVDDYSESLHVSDIELDTSSQKQEISDSTDFGSIGVAEQQAVHAKPINLEAFREDQNDPDEAFFDLENRIQKLSLENDAVDELFIEDDEDMPSQPNTSFTTSSLSITTSTTPPFTSPVQTLSKLPENFAQFANFKNQDSPKSRLSLSKGVLKHTQLKKTRSN